jgi:maltoporin
MTSYQLMAVYDMSGANGWGQGIVRYADGADNSVYTRDDDLSTLFFQWEGSYKLSSDFELGYLAAYHDLENKTPMQPIDASRTNTSLIARPMYSWSDIHSTWAELGYGLVNYNDAGENSAWKVTLSQNISFGEATSGDRPMLRFYATFGDTDNEVTDGTAGNMDTMSLGAMFESWW